MQEWWLAKVAQIVAGTGRHPGFWTPGAQIGTLLGTPELPRKTISDEENRKFGEVLHA
jgi:hypothetical protein